MEDRRVRRRVEELKRIADLFELLAARHGGDIDGEDHGTFSRGLYTGLEQAYSMAAESLRRELGYLELELTLGEIDA